MFQRCAEKHSNLIWHLTKKTAHSTHILSIQTHLGTFLFWNSFPPCWFDRFCIWWCQMISTDCLTGLKRQLLIAAFSHCSWVKVCVSSLMVCAWVCRKESWYEPKGRFTQSCKGQEDRTTVWPIEHTAGTCSSLYKSSYTSTVSPEISTASELLPLSSVLDSLAYSIDSWGGFINKLCAVCWQDKEKFDALKSRKNPLFNTVCLNKSVVLHSCNYSMLQRRVVSFNLPLFG